LSKIVFVNPVLTGKERYGYLSQGGVYLPPLGLCHLAAVTRKNGFETYILDCDALGLNVGKASEFILSCKPDYVGITAATPAIYKAAELADVLKQKDNKLITILGGTHLTAVPEETMETFPKFDIGVIGEGEITIIELLQKLDKNGDLDGIRGIIFRRNGNLKITDCRPLIDDLDQLPLPAWDLLPNLTKYYRPSCFGFKKLPVASLITSRGCPAGCSFCANVTFGRKYREHSSRYVIQMIKYLHKNYGIKDFAIYDDTFGVRKERLVKLCQMLIKEKLDVVWSSNARIDQITPEILGLMKKAGCWQIAYGIESGSQRILDFLHKDITLEEISRVLKWTESAGLIVKGYIMIGTLAETKESIQKTIDFVLKSNLDLITVNNFTPFPGTEDYKRAEQFGTFNPDWRLLTQHHLVFVPNGLTNEEIENSIRLITRKFYLRPKVILKHLGMIFSFSKLCLLFNGLIALLKFIYFRHSLTYDQETG